MSKSLFSSSWYRVNQLRPRLRRHAQVHRHRYRGRVWYVLEDVANQRFHRFTPTAHTTIGLMDGERTLEEVWRITAETLGDDAPTQDEMIRLLAQLHAADVLRCEVPPDTAELLERFQKKESKEWQQRLMNPFAIRIPLLDPERILERGLPLVRPLFGWLGALLWLAVVVPALFLAGVHWSALTEGVLDHLFAPQNLVLIWLIFPLVKALHEFGHGFAAKAFGAEVHDMGIMFLVFTPVPYVDASSASAFPEKRRRALVGAAGMIVEVFVAALALHFWSAAEPGVARTLAYNTILIAGITTLGFNANPLLRFDGYYILADLIEIPNLRARGNQYVGYLVERYAFGRPEAEPPDAEPGEKAWLVTYTVAAFLYRILVVVAIMMFVLGKSLVLGALLGIVAGVGWIGRPIAKGLRFVVSDPRIRRVRGRAVGVVAGAVAALLVIVCLLPVPLRKRTEGVVWIPEEALVRARVAGFIERVVAPPGSRVEMGDLLIACRDPDLEAQVVVLGARLRGLDVRYARERTSDLARAEILDEQRRYVRGHLARARERLAELEIRSATDGVFVVPQAEDLPGRYARQGELLAHVVDLDSILVRAVVAQHDIDLVHDRLEGVDVRLAERLGQVVQATTARIVPAAVGQLPHRALGTAGGGQVAVDPRDERGVTAVEKWFQIDLELPDDMQRVSIGGRAYVRFDLGTGTCASTSEPSRSRASGTAGCGGSSCRGSMSSATTALGLGIPRGAYPKRLERPPRKLDELGERAAGVVRRRIKARRLRAERMARKVGALGVEVGKLSDGRIRAVEEKWREVVARIGELYSGGRPVLVGTRSVAASEHLSEQLDAVGLPHVVLNARQDREEAEIVARAAEPGRITVATNMAGRGTDIVLAAGVAELGGLHVLATERHNARRIDRQLFGRCEHQGDPGTAEAIVSLENELCHVYVGGLAKRLARIAGAAGTGPGHFAGRLHSRMRCDLLKVDAQLDSMLAFSGRPE